FLCDQHGDVRHDRRVAVRLFQVRAISARTAPGLSGLDYHGAGHIGRILDSLAGLIGGAQWALGRDDAALAQADRDYPAALCLRRNGYFARADSQPLACWVSLR